MEGRRSNLHRHFTLSPVILSVVKNLGVGLCYSSVGWNPDPPPRLLSIPTLPPSYHSRLNP
jgi:hypothetical protein